MEDYVDLIGKRENYVEYIAKRPRVERQGSHGLFTDEGIPINLSAVAKEVANHKGVVFTEILSLRREDAVRLGYDSGIAWRNLLRSQTDAMAQAMRIPLTDLRWYAAFHNESHHPHVHIVAYSAGREPYMTEQGLRKLKSTFARQIFKQDLVQVYTEQTKRRNDLTQKSRNTLSDMIARINTGSYDNSVVTDLLLKLSQQMKCHKDKNISALYDLWYEQRDVITGMYQDASEKRIPLSQNKEFKAIKNAVIQESLNILYDRVTFEESVSDVEAFAPDVSEEEEPSVQTKWWNDSHHPLFQYRKAKEHLQKDSLLYDPVKAVWWLHLSAAQGYKYAQYRLGKLYLLGDEIAQNIPQAEEWFEKASAQGSRYAKYSLAKMHLAGLARMSDEHKAVRLLWEAADSGNQWAQYLLAKLYLCEEDIPKDVEKALLWLRKSVKQENQYAQYQLGKMLLLGQDAEQDMAEGVRLLSAAAEQGNVYADRLLQSYHSGWLKNPSAGMAFLRLYSQLARIFQDRLCKNEGGQRAIVEKKLRQQIEEKKQAHGMKMG